MMKHFLFFFTTYCKKDDVDVFKSLGLDTFKLDLEQKPKAQLVYFLYQVKVQSVEDLPRLIEQGKYSADVGMQLIKKFLTDDDETLKQIGAVYDQTGFDGLDPSEDVILEQNQSRIEQRAKSAALMFIKDNEPNSDYEVYNVQPDTEKVKDWLTFLVLMMNSSGKHKLMKVCIHEKEVNGYLSYGMDQHDTCANKVETFTDLEQRSKRYFKESGFDKFSNDKNKIQQPPQVKDDKKESGKFSQNKKNNENQKKDDKQKNQEGDKKDDQKEEDTGESLQDKQDLQDGSGQNTDSSKQDNKQLQSLVMSLMDEVKELKSQLIQNNDTKITSLNNSDKKNKSIINKNKQFRKK